MNPVASCPQPQQLESLVQGRLPFGQVEQLAQHLELCQRCVQTVASFKADDTLVEVIRRQAAAQGKAPDAVLKNLMERLRDMKASAGAVDPENYDFLAPAQAPGELGRLGQYRVLKVLGAGGMGVVFQAEDTQLKRIVALKAMRPALAASPTAKQRFVREAQASAAMKHDHIITIYQVGEERSVPFLAMEFLEGTSLEDYLKKGKPMTLGQVLRVGREIAEGLAAAHQRNLVHRDIKPANIWLEAPKGRIKILDFGLARSTDEQTNITLAGAIVGTPAYMAPEQASSKPTDHRTDLYSLGCVLYRLCTGDVPFRGDNAMATLLAMATEEVRPVRTLNPAIPEPLANLVMKLLAKNPDERCQSAKEVVSAIAAIERGQQTMGRVGDVSPPVTAKDTQRLFGDMHPPSQIIAARGPKPRRSNARFAVLIGVATLVLVAGAVAAWQVVIRIKRGDSQVEITAPAGAAVEIEKDGKVRILPPATVPQIRQDTAPRTPPKKDPPKVEPKKAEPKEDPRPEPKVEPKKEEPKVEPKKDPPKPAKAAVPDAAALAKADLAVKETFKAEYAKRKPEDLLSLAKALLDLGRETTDDPAARFVCLREARDLAAQALDLAASTQAIEELERAFRIDAADMKLAALELAGKSATTQAAAQSLAEAAQESVEELLAADQFDAAVRALKAAEAAAAKTRSIALLATLQARGKDVEALRKEFLQADKAAALLKDKPDDAAANLALGKYLFLVKGHWDEGLPPLAKGSDAKLRDLARLDLAVPTEAAKQVELGDGWYNLGQAEKGKPRAHLLGRAQLWYKEALPTAAGLAKARIEKRLEELEQSGSAATPPRRERYVPLALGSAANADTTKALWGTPQEKIIFPQWGEHKYMNVPFALPEPKDGKHNAIVLRAGWLPNNAYPKEASVPCDVACKTIHLLSGIAGSGFPQIKERSVTMVVRLHYADGGTEDHELLNGIHFANLDAANNVTGSRQAFKLPLPVPGGPNGSWSHSQVRYVAIIPRKPNVRIDTIEFTKGAKGDIASPVVMGVTVENSSPTRVEALPPPSKPVYLSDLKEIESKTVNGHPFSNNGENSFNRSEKRIVAGGVHFKKGLAVHGNSNQVAYVAYALGKQYKTLSGGVAVNDTAHHNGGAASPVTFVVVGDGKELWRSPGLQKAGASAKFTANVAGVNRLDLRVLCTDANSAHAVWLDPFISGQEAKATLSPVHEGVIRALAFSPNSQQLATGGDDEVIRIYDVSTGKPALVFSSEYVSHLAWSPDSSTLVSASKDKVVRFWDAKTGKLLRTTSIAADVTCLAWSPNGKALAIVGADQSLQLWDANTKMLKAGPQGGIKAAWSPDGKMLATFPVEGSKVQIWSAEMRPIKTIGVRGKLNTVVWSPDGKKLAANGGDDNDLWVLDAATGEVLKKTQRAGDGWFAHLAWAFDNKKVVSAHEHASLCLWNPETGNLIRRIGGHDASSGIVALTQSPDGKTVASCGTDRTVRISLVAGESPPIVIRGTPAP